MHSGPVLAQRDGLTVIDCRACGWAHLDPLPVIPDGYYESEFWQTKGAGWLARYEAERDWLDMRNGDWLSVVEEHTDGRRLLDVGAGYGFFLKSAIDRHWAVCCGIDLSIEASDYALRHNIFIEHMGWQDTNYPINFSDGYAVTYDCISALWLMEHLPNPFEFLGWARAHLAPGGALLLAVPQEWTGHQLMANRVANVKNYWLHPTHLNYWTAATLSNMLGRAGFRVVDTLASFPIETYIHEYGCDYTDDPAKGDAAHAEIRKLELGMTQSGRLSWSRDCARGGQGRDLVVVCK